jgi:hypothetical protein
MRGESHAKLVRLQHLRLGDVADVAEVAAQLGRRGQGRVGVAAGLEGIEMRPDLLNADQVLVVEPAAPGCRGSPKAA